MSKYLDKWKRPKTANTRVIDIYMAGSYTDARRVCGEYCAQQGYCFSIVKTDYAHGCEDEVMGYRIEAGIKVTLINYPRFPEEHDDMENRAIIIAKSIARVNDQGSFTIASNKLSKFYSRRKDD